MNGVAFLFIAASVAISLAVILRDRRDARREDAQFAEFQAAMRRHPSYTSQCPCGWSTRRSDLDRLDRDRHRHMRSCGSWSDGL